MGAMEGRFWYDLIGNLSITYLLECSLSLINLSFSWIFLCVSLLLLVFQECFKYIYIYVFLK